MNHRFGPGSFSCLRLRRQVIAKVIGVLLTGAALMPAVESTATLPRLANAKVGMFVHYVHGLTQGDARGAKPANLQVLAEALDVDAVAETAKQAGAEYLIFTVYHAGIHMLYPSPLWGAVFPDKVSKRDVIGDLAEAAKKRGLALVLYVHPNDRHDLSKTDQQRLIDLGLAESILTGDALFMEKKGDLQLTGLRGADPKWNAFYFKLIEEIGQRYGTRIAGYWQDGPGPDGLVVRGIMQKHTPNAAIWLNSAATRPDLPPATLLGGEFIAKPSTKAEERTSATTNLQNSITISKDWWGTNNPALYPAESLFRLTVTMAATQGQTNGGFVLAAGPRADNTWGPGVAEALKAHGALMQIHGKAIYGTLPSTAWITTSWKDQRTWGVATESTDGGTVYVHVLRPPTAESTLALGAPRDHRTFSSAHLLRGEKNVALTQDKTGVSVTLPAGEAWDPIDTVLVLRVARSARP